ncbi:MAG: MATE family efflux transporter [Planctomycetes bacterium]|nr:MATE family efflux transporter [Planctomycetota bacterium]
MSMIEKHFKGPGGMGEMIAIAAPMVISNACDTIMTFTDRYFLSRLGSAQMSAAMGGGMTCFMLMTFFIGLTGYLTAIVAQYLGAGKRERCASVLAQGLIISLAAYPLVLACRPLGFKLFEFAGIAPEQLVPQKAYFSILLYGVVIGLFRHCFACFFSGLGRTRIVMFASLGAMAINIGANYILIFGRLGFPALGIEGAAYGTLIGGACGLLVLLLAFVFMKRREPDGVWGAFVFDWQIMKKIFRFGSPAGLEFVLNFMAFNAMIMAFQSKGLVVSSAVTMLFNWDMVSFVPLIGVGVGVTSLVGKYMGAGDPETAHRSTISGLKMGWMYSAVILVFFFGYPHILVGMFKPAGEDQVFAEAAPLAITMIRMASLYVMIESVVVAFSSALRGAGDTFWTMCISVTLHWIMVPVMIFILKFTSAPATTAWGCGIGTFLLFSLAFYLRYRSGRWRSIKVVGDDGETQNPPLEDFHEQAEL